MSIKRIQALLAQEYFVTIHSLETFFDIFVFSFITLFLYGFFSLYLIGNENMRAAQYLLLGMLFWEIVRVGQYSVSVASMWNIWFRNLTHLFVSPVSTLEYFTAHSLSGVVKAFSVFIIDAIITLVFFHFSVFEMDIGFLFLAFVNLAVFSISTGIVIVGLIFRFGTRIQSFAWGLVPILQPLTAAFFPVSVLPQPLQYFAYLFPTTYIFEASRLHLDTHLYDWQALFVAVILNILYLIGSVLFFQWFYTISRNTGQFARNEA
ncbi:ABC transporter permease [Candidatus Gottesmanbacteria bacterium]|nr:ABC transporter permease [Candidatus Gottesmanbacteria bacterium]